MPRSTFCSEPIALFLRNADLGVNGNRGKGFLAQTATSARYQHWGRGRTRRWRVRRTYRCRSTSAVAMPWAASTPVSPASGWSRVPVLRRRCTQPRLAHTSSTRAPGPMPAARNRLSVGRRCGSPWRASRSRSRSVCPDILVLHLTDRPTPGLSRIPRRRIVGRRRSGRSGHAGLPYSEVRKPL